MRIGIGIGAGIGDDGTLEQMLAGSNSGGGGV